MRYYKIICRPSRATIYVKPRFDISVKSAANALNESLLLEIRENVSLQAYRAYSCRVGSTTQHRIWHPIR